MSRTWSPSRTRQPKKHHPGPEQRSYSRLWLTELLRRLRRDIVWHDCIGKAAELAFFSACNLFAGFCSRFYLRYAPSYDGVYGSLGAFVILMLWLYLVALMIYLGAEINSEIGTPAGKPAAQKE